MLSIVNSHGSREEIVPQADLLIYRAQRPSINIVANSSSFLCSEQFLVVGEDFATFEVDLSRNNSDYTYKEFDWPTFHRQKLATVHGVTKTSIKLICEPFVIPKNGFCVKRPLTNTTGCSCEVVGTQVYLVKLVYSIEDVNETRGRLELFWPSVTLGPISTFYYLPEVRAEPNITSFQITPSFNCTLEYQVESVDYTILELDVSDNSSRYSFKKDVWPRFEYKTRRNGKLSKAILFCTPFTIPQNEFCVTKQSFPNSCSCEHVGKDTFRLRANFTIKSQDMSHGQISLTWPGRKGPVRYDYNLPKVKMRPGTLSGRDIGVHVPPLKPILS
ncbi:hypothetical protein PoB_003534200 [Plakobranchus ocellatus]|uniref:Arrestin-like N-terminal domain-containing protein n=1 Tax=Plakobranchus ocellatus TaxID=259542 RepID=A0AAV4APH3_9GAST|nr:hypothetical protein PoB_003534200 [Plakobranchus ocellatus]